MSGLEKLKRLMQMEILEIEISPNLACLVEDDEERSIIDAVIAVREALAEEFGFVMGRVRIRDNPALAESEYQILFNEKVTFSGFIEPQKLLLIFGDDQARDSLSSDLNIIKEPAYGLDAAWIDTEDAQYYEDKGYTVVSAVSVLNTHLLDVCKANAHLLFRLESLLALLEAERELSGRLIEHLIPGIITVERMHKILYQLLKQKLSLRPFNLVLENLAYYEDLEGPRPDIVDYMRDRLKTFNQDIIRC